MQHNERFLKLAQAAKQQVKEISAEQLQQQLERNAVTLIDVREESEWARDHLPQAQHLSRGVLEVKIEGVIPDTTTPLVLYCGGGYRSALAAESLQKMGYSQVLSLEGGYSGWKAAGYPVMQG